ncbi:MAG: hypothetical protein KA536_11050 [Saprospiraceae bacterium]|jgi:hypothetical protein|nr:hypothetical protein [Saprospiraceae bacterium]
MDQSKYEFRKTNELHFDFISVGKKGEIHKRVTFIELEYGFFNMGLGDLNPESAEVDYFSVSDNGDRNTILATVSEIIVSFFELYPSHTIYFKGTSRSRTRLYQMAINHFYDELSERFHILGELDDKMTRFKRNTNYKSFLILKK